MKRNKLIMLAIIALTLIASTYWQDVVGLTTSRSNVYLSYAIWLTLDVVAIWSIFAIGRIKPHEPDHSPLEYGGMFIFLLGAVGFSALASTAIAEFGALFDPVMITQFEEAKEIFKWNPEKNFVSRFWPIIVAPVTEEIIFRVGILGALMQFMKKPWAILLSSLAFALVHADIYAPVAVAGTFVFGVVAAATYIMLGLRAAIILHFIGNAKEMFRPWIDSSEYITIGYVLLMITSVCVFLHQMIKNRRVVLC